MEQSNAAAQPFSLSQRLMSILGWVVVFVLLAVYRQPLSTQNFLLIVLLAGLVLSFYFARWLFPTSPIPVVPNISILFTTVMTLGPFSDLLVILLTAPVLVAGMRHVRNLALFWAVDDAVSTIIGYITFLVFGGHVGLVSLSQWWAYLAFWLAYYVSNSILIPVYYWAGIKGSLKQFYVEQVFTASAWAMNVIDLVFGFVMLFAMADYGIRGIIFISLALWLVNVNYRSLLRSFLQSQRDALTGLLNRRYFRDKLEKAIKMNQTVSLLMLDLDNFKMYNDRHGHVSGDKLLQQVAQLLTFQSGQVGLVCRYGGEEFAIILPGVPSTEALAMAECIRLAISNQAFAGMETQPKGRITISIGVATYPEISRSLDELIQQADAALYQVKFRNRDGSQLYEEETNQ